MTHNLIHTISYRTFAALMLLFVLGGMPNTAQAYFGDQETSEENVFSASSLGIAAAVLDEDDDFREVEIVVDEDSDVEYRLTGSYSGSFCGNADVLIQQNGNEVYNGPLIGFSASAPTLLASSGSDQWRFNFSPIDGNGDDGDCIVTWSYEANQNGYAYGQAFFDVETDQHTINGAALGVVPPPAPSPTGPSSVTINEVMYDLATGDDTAREWVEVYNGSGAPVDLSGWTFVENGTQHGMTLDSGTTTLASGEYALIVDDPAGFAGDHSVSGVSIFDSSFEMANSATSTLELRDSTDTVIDTIDLTPASGGNGDGNSLGRTGITWCATVPTPGDANDVCVGP
ncbi:MAG: lamin tail domain-containing protein [Candidatus Paceibacterota bacterium]